MKKVKISKKAMARYAERPIRTGSSMMYTKDEHGNSVIGEQREYFWAPSPSPAKRARTDAGPDATTSLQEANTAETLSPLETFTMHTDSEELPPPVLEAPPPHPATTKWSDIRDDSTAQGKKEHSDTQSNSARSKKKETKVRTCGLNRIYRSSTLQRSPSDRYAEWKSKFDDIAEDMFTWEDTENPLDKCTSCLREDAKYRCPECWSSGPRCGNCHRAAHKNLWFHWAERWNGEFWERIDLFSIGFIIYLGHGGQRCPALSVTTTPSNMTIVHTNGTHYCTVHYCHCLKARERHSQLIRARIWPTTLASPQTAFTVPLLRHYDLLWLICNVSAYNFMRVMQRSSDSAFPDKITVRYCPRVPTTIQLNYSIESIRRFPFRRPVVHVPHNEKARRSLSSAHNPPSRTTRPHR